MLILLGVGLHVVLAVALGALGFECLCILVFPSLLGSGVSLCIGPASPCPAPLSAVITVITLELY